ncbi:MAG: sirohydrochlorin cobaltochelatase [Thermodesulfobacteriota bacterium]
MAKKWIWILAVMIVFLASVNPALAVHGEKRPMQKAILLVAFGTSDPEAQKTFVRIEDQTRKAFPGVEIRWAYTSAMIRKKLARQGKVLDSPEVALARLMEGGFTHVAVLSLHTIPGEEFHQLYRNAHHFALMEGGFERIMVARPLLSSSKDMDTVAAVLLKSIPGRKPSDGVLFMGHGSERHPADAIYLAMNQVFQDLDPNVFVSTVDGRLALENVLPKLQSRKVGKVYLVPLMSVAGEHARKDMAGDEPDSWKSVLTKNGFKCEAILKGTADNPEIVNVWLEHLAAVLSHF